MAWNKKTIYDQLRDREKEPENCKSMSTMLVNKFLTAKLGREKGKFVKHFPRD